MTLHEFVIRLLDLETYVIRCEELADVSAFRTEIQNVVKDRYKYKEEDYKEIISRGHRKLKRLIGEEKYQQMFVIKLPDYSKYRC